MINVSNQLKKELHNDNRKYLNFADITLKDGAFLSLESDCIWSDGLGVEDAVSNSSSFDIGSAIINKGTLVLNNLYDDFSKYDFDEAKVILKTGLRLPDGTIEKINKGEFTVDETKYNGAIISLECLDDMRKFDKDYSKSNLVYPATCWEIVQDACSVCDVAIGIASIPNGNKVIQERPNDEALTFRQMLQWVGQLTCQWFKINRFGQLISGFYDVESYESLRIISGGNLGDGLEEIVSAGTFGDGLQDTVSAGTFGDRKDYHNIHSLNSSNIVTDDVVITGIRVTEYSSDSLETPATYLSGEEGYVLSIEKNRLITIGMGREVADYLGNKLIGLRFRPLSVSFQSDPTIEAGDIALVSDYKGNIFKTLITGTKFQVGSAQTVTCGAKTPSKNSANRYSEATREYVESRKEAQKIREEMDKAVEKLEGKLNNSSGMFMTEEEQDDGSVIRYLHDKKTIAESQNVIKFTSEAIGVSNDGGKTYPYGFMLTGEMVIKILQAIGVNADWIKTGTLVIKDKNGKETFYANADTGAVRVDAESFKINAKDIMTVIGENQNIIISDTAPDNDEKMWCDTSVSPPVLKKLENGEWITVNDNAEELMQLYSDITTMISNVRGEIEFEVENRTYTKGEVENLLSEQSTKLTQTYNDFLFQFNAFKQQVGADQDETNGKFEEYNKYIRFTDGSIVLGVVGNPITAVLKNDRFSFYQNNYEVAYVSDNTLYIRHVVVLEDLSVKSTMFKELPSGYFVMTGI